MRTVVLGPRPAELQSLIDRRRTAGGDLYDEVWEGEYHMPPAVHPFHGYLDDEVAAILRPLARRAGLIGTGPFNLGTADDYRVPDRGLHRELPVETWVVTAAIVVEILSPDDETGQKLPFYATHGVDEVLIVDPGKRTVKWLTRRDDRYHDSGASGLLGVSAREIGQQIAWPG